VENRNYTVEQWTPSKHLRLNRSQDGRLEKLYLNQDGIKRGGVAQVRKFFRSKYVNVPPPDRAWPSEAARFVLHLCLAAGSGEILLRKGQKEIREPRTVNRELLFKTKPHVASPFKISVVAGTQLTGFYFTPT